MPEMNTSTTHHHHLNYLAHRYLLFVEERAVKLLFLNVLNFYCAHTLTHSRGFKMSGGTSSLWVNHCERLTHLFSSVLLRVLSVPSKVGIKMCFETFTYLCVEFLFVSWGPRVCILVTRMSHSLIHPDSKGRWDMRFFYVLSITCERFAPCVRCVRVSFPLCTWLIYVLRVCAGEGWVLSSRSVTLLLKVCSILIFLMWL